MLTVKSQSGYWGFDWAARFVIDLRGSCSLSCSLFRWDLRRSFMSISKLNYTCYSVMYFTFIVNDMVNHPVWSFHPHNGDPPWIFTIKVLCSIPFKRRTNRQLTCWWSGWHRSNWARCGQIWRDILHHILHCIPHVYVFAAKVHH